MKLVQESTVGRKKGTYVDTVKHVETLLKGKQVPEGQLMAITFDEAKVSPTSWRDVGGIRIALKRSFDPVSISLKKRTIYVRPKAKESTPKQGE